MEENLQTFWLQKIFVLKLKRFSTIKRPINAFFRFRSVITPNPCVNCLCVYSVEILFSLTVRSLKNKHSYNYRCHNWPLFSNKTNYNSRNFNKNFNKNSWALTVFTPVLLLLFFYHLKLCGKESIRENNGWHTYCSVSRTYYYSKVEGEMLNASLLARRETKSNLILLSAKSWKFHNKIFPARRN